MDNHNSSWKVIALINQEIEAVTGSAAQDRPAYTKRWSGKGKHLTKAKPSNVRRRPTPELTWSGCAFATSGTLITGRISLSPIHFLTSSILGPKTRTGSRFRLPVSGVRRECRGDVRGTLPTVRTARAVWFIDRRMHSRWSQSHLLSRKHATLILLCATDCNTLKYWSLARLSFLYLLIAGIPVASENLLFPLQRCRDRRQHD